MRLSELLDKPVTDASGASIGHVADVILVQDGPLMTQGAAAYRVAGIIVSEKKHSELLGYERDLRPALFRVLARKLAGDVRRAEWSDIDRIDDDGVVLRRNRSDLSTHQRADRV